MRRRTKDEPNENATTERGREGGRKRENERE
jgi:hypothetical protein